MIATLLLATLAAADPTVVAGPVEHRGEPLALPAGLSLARCTDGLPAAALPAAGAEGGRLTFTLRIRRNEVALVTTAHADPAVAPLGACLERELASATWPVRRGRLDVPVTVAPAAHE